MPQQKIFVSGDFEIEWYFIQRSRIISKENVLQKSRSIFLLAHNYLLTFDMQLSKDHKVMHHRALFLAYAKKFAGRGDSNTRIDKAAEDMRPRGTYSSELSPMPSGEEGDENCSCEGADECSGDADHSACTMFPIWGGLFFGKHWQVGNKCLGSLLLSCEVRKADCWIEDSPAVCTERSYLFPCFTAHLVVRTTTGRHQQKRKQTLKSFQQHERCCSTVLISFFQILPWHRYILWSTDYSQILSIQSITVSPKSPEIENAAKKEGFLATPSDFLLVREIFWDNEWDAAREDGDLATSSCSRRDNNLSCHFLSLRLLPGSKNCLKQRIEGRMRKYTLLSRLASILPTVFSFQGIWQRGTGQQRAGNKRGYMSREENQCCCQVATNSGCPSCRSPVD